MAVVLVFIYMTTIYVRPQDWVPGLIGLPTGNLIIPLAFVPGYLSYLRERQKFQMPQNWIVPLYLLVIFVSTFVNTDFSEAWEQALLFLQRALVFFMVVWALDTRKRIQGAVAWMLALTLFLAYQAIIQGTTGQSWGGLTPYPGYEEIRVRWYGDWDGPNVFGILFVISAAMALEMVFGTHSTAIRVLGVGLTAAYLSAIFYTNSRGAILALAAAMLFYFQKRFRSAPAIIIAVLALGALFALGPSRMGEVNSQESSARERTWLWEQGLNLLRENPVLGIGRNQFARQTDLNLIAHSNYVQNFAETGFSGFFLFTSLLWFSFKGNMMLSNPKYNVDPALASFGRMMMAAIVGYCAATFFVVMEQDLLYFLLALCASVYLVAARESESLPRLHMSRKDFLMVAGGMFGLISLIWLAAVKEIL